MALIHKAFVFDQESFDKQLSAVLESALVSGNGTALVLFIEENLSALKDPCEGDSLDSSWQRMIEDADPHQYGDFALTKFYDPAANIGLGASWESVENLLQSETGKGAGIVLGKPLGPAHNYFDPGKMGSYFQTTADVRTHLQLLEHLVWRKPELAGILDETTNMLVQAARVNQGLYVTF